MLNIHNVGKLQVKWSYAPSGLYYDQLSSPVVADGVVYLGATNDNVYALKAETGAVLWSYTTGNFVESLPAVANGVVYVGSNDDNLYALKE